MSYMCILPLFWSPPPAERAVSLFSGLMIQDVHHPVANFVYISFSDGKIVCIVIITACCLERKAK